MAITQFEIEGYEKLRSINKVTMEPNAKLQCILGTNGSGKSALMNELSLLCADHRLYRSNGYKDITTTIKGDTYRGISDFTGDKRHYELHKNGQEVYSGHSSVAYNSHVKNETKMTPDIHAMRIGDKKFRFTSMSKEARREWFTNLSPENYGYAIGYYKRLGTATRDITGTINRINKRLKEEKEKLIDAEAEKLIREEIEELNKVKIEMMQHWRPMEMSVEQALENVEQIDYKLIEMTKGFNESLLAYCNSKGYKSQQDIWDDISKTQTELSILEKQIHDTHEVIESNQKLITEAMKIAGNDEASIKIKIAELSRSIVSTKYALLTDAWLGNAKQAIEYYDAVIPELLPLMDMLTEDTELQYTQAKHKENTDKLNEIQRVIEALELDRQKKISLIEVYEHKSQSNHMECPKCQHTWIHGYNQTEHEKLQKERDEINLKIEELKAKYTSIHSLLETSSYQLQLLNQIGLLARANPVLSNMWKGLTDAHFIRLKPKSAIEYVKAVRVQIEYSIELLNYQEQIKELEAQLTISLNTAGVNQQDLMDKNAILESRLVRYQTEAFQLQKSLTGYKKAQKAMEYQERFIPEAEDLLSKRGDWLSKAEVANHHAAVNAVMMHIESEITQKERLLTQIDSQHRFISALEREVEESKAKEKLMTKALKALSPTEGLIAKGLTGFINHFIAQMNAVIEKVWLYPLVIKPITITDTEGVDLDYKFPFTIDDRSAGNDVADGSGAQMEIFDLAFMLVSMMHLGLDDSEIFLDEFSIKMDYAHRQEAMKMVMDLVISSNFSQIFMISHYESSYGNLSDADITVLCSDNIQLPEDLKYNVHSKIIK